MTQNLSNFFVSFTYLNVNKLYDLLTVKNVKDE